MTVSLEQTPTSATYVLTAGLVFALKQEAKRRKVSVSELVRDLLAESLPSKQAETVEAKAA